jgi:hypothetical protein
MISEPIYDLENELINNVSWSPCSLRSCYESALPTPDCIHSDTPMKRLCLLHLAYLKMRLAQSNGTSTTSVWYVLTLATRQNMCASAVALAHGSSETVPRPDGYACKWSTSVPEKLKGVLGSELNSRKLTMSLTQVNFEIWLKSSVGRLKNVARIMPHMRHFMARIRKVTDQCVEHNKPCTKLSHTLCANFTLIHRLTWKAQDDIITNLLNHRNNELHLDEWY